MVDHDRSADDDLSPSGARRERGPLMTAVVEPNEVLKGQLETVFRHLLEEFRGTADPQAIGREFGLAFAQHCTARVHTYVAALTYRSAREALRRLAASSAA
jgi:hypothetical protein